MNTGFQPDYSVSVWQVIVDEMNERKMDQSDVAIAMAEDPSNKGDVGTNYLALDVLRTCSQDSRIVLSEETASKLERAFGVSAAFQAEQIRLSCVYTEETAARKAMRKQPDFIKEL